MKAYPLKQATYEEALALQFRFVDCITHHFNGLEIVQDGDYGHSLAHELGRPLFTAKVEAVMSEFFGAEDCVLVRGAGTGAIRNTLMALLRAGDRVLLHRAPTYPTTRLSLEFLGLQPVFADFHDPAEIASVIEAEAPIGAVLIQHSRNRLDDSYDLETVIGDCRAAAGDRPPWILVDDNYMAFRVTRIGTQQGADFSAFSLFKLLGPPSGIGCVIVGTPRGLAAADRLRAANRSGGARIQGPEAMDAMRALCLAPVSLYTQGQVVDEVVRRLQTGEVPGVAEAWVTNCNSRSAIVEFEKPIVPAILDRTPALGAQRQTIGSESRMEVVPIFHPAFPYWSDTDYDLLRLKRDRLLRVNPHRSGPDTILGILKQAVKDVHETAR